MSVSIVPESAIRRAVSAEPAALDAIAEAFVALSSGRVSMPPVIRVDIHAAGGEVDVKTAYIKGLDSFAIKIASGFPGNSARGLPSGSGMMVLMSAETGFLKSVLLDNGYLTDLRTGLAGAVAARHLAPLHVHTVGVFGSGQQARWQVRCLRLVRDVRRVLVHAQTAANRRRYVEEMEAELGIEVRAVDDPAQLVQESQVVITATPAATPFLQPQWLHPGLHITAVGADGEHKQELGHGVLEAASILACDSRRQCAQLGEMRHLRAGAIEDVAELGELAAGLRPGRQREDEISVCDLTGVGVQDTAIARLCVARVEALGLGTVFAD